MNPHPTPTGLQVYGSPRNYLGGHIGSDYGVGVGTPVLAISNGVVTESSYNDLVGNFVRIDHDNGVTTRSIHLSTRSVTAGQRVTAGQQIGLSGQTGSAADGPHLHIEVYLNRTNRTDPHAFFLTYVGPGNDEGDELTPEQDARLKNIEAILATDDNSGRAGIRGVVNGNRATLSNIEGILTRDEFEGRTGGIRGAIQGLRSTGTNIEGILTRNDGGGIRGVVDAIKAKLGA